ncbi:hypothetical protein C7H19_22755 [Aphanothece hegewaldii CCALA 016]|uniref:PEP-CTERM sorting domain-containing protein n=1 Tax=Aphanothece hegewaldii CCALA 016 TaxID=2107694 RepID=A0A2T1LRM6_9CHRO|nr:hypothetical protein [Aphanothece hegewaldii]PSF31401.1 hypothetical protein C7H19_22755 [Aphanothece hegewaldii CCALA 016]
MITCSQTRRFCLIFFSSVSYFLISAFPIRAATFSSFAQYDLSLKNFSQSPQNIFSVGDGDANTIADDGILSSFIDTDAKFLVTPNDTSAYSKSETLLVGTTNNYLGNIRFTTSLIGNFTIPANETLLFSFDGFINLLNQTDDLVSSNLSSSIQFNLLLLDKTTQTVNNILEVLGVINTNSELDYKQDFFGFQTGQDTVLNSYNELTSFGEMNEVINNSFSGLYNKQFAQDTQLDLIIVTQSCNYTSNRINVCKRIPEPANKFILIDLLVVLISVGLFVKVMK